MDHSSTTSQDTSRVNSPASPSANGTGPDSVDFDALLDGYYFSAEEIAAGQAAAAAEAAEAALDLDDEGLPVIQGNDRQTRHVYADAMAAIVRRHKADPRRPLLYVRDATLCRVVASERQRDEHGRLTSDQGKIAPAENAQIRYTLGVVASWVNVAQTKAGDKSTHVAVPQTVVSHMTGAGQYPELPLLAGISYCPTVDADGKFFTEDGYNPRTGIYHENAVALGDTRPTDKNLAAAVALWDELIADFPFVDAASRAHAIAFGLLPFVREAILGPTPLHAVAAPTMGTGKGLLIEALVYPGRGHELASAPAPEDEAEWAKAITAWLLEGRTHVALDNVNAPLDSGSLAAALTQPRWGNRALGTNTTVSLPIRTIWSVTGNNLLFSGEIGRRVCYIRLDANCEQPDQRRGFRHDPLMPWVQSKRPELVTAAIVMVNRWIADGRPAFTDRVKGSYEGWTRTIGGILACAGIDGFLANMDDVASTASTEAETLRAFVAEWAAKWDTQAVPASDLITVASYDDDPHGWQGLDLLSEVCTAAKEGGRRRQMGRYISKHAGRVVSVTVGGSARQYKVKAPAHGRGGVVYQLDRVS